MKIKLDENLGNRGADVLRASGHEVTTMAEEGLSCASDEDPSVAQNLGPYTRSLHKIRRFLAETGCGSSSLPVGTSHTRQWPSWPVIPRHPRESGEKAGIQVFGDTDALPAGEPNPNAKESRTTPTGQVGRREAAHALAQSAARGRELARLLDSDTPVPGVTSGRPRPEIAAIAVPATTHDRNMSGDDFALTARVKHDALRPCCRRISRVVGNNE